MNGYKTIVTGFITFLSGLALMVGIELPPELLDILKDNIELTVGAITSLLGVIFTILRFFTDGPVAKGKSNV